MDSELKQGITPSNKSILMMIGTMTLFLVFIIITLTALKAYNNNNDSNGTNITPTPNLSQCEYNGIKYDSGQSFEVENGCSACTCSDGNVTCKDREEMTKYTNSNFPDFSFEYNSCEWVLDNSSIEEKNNAFIKVVKDSSIILFDFEPAPLGGGMPYCAKFDFNAVNNSIVRVKLENYEYLNEKEDSLQTDFNNKNVYRYFQDYYTNGSSEFEEYSKFFDPDNSENYNICFHIKSGYHFKTNSSFFGGNFSVIDLYLITNHSVSDTNLEDADKVINSVEH